MFTKRCELDFVVLSDYLTFWVQIIGAIGPDLLLALCRVDLIKILRCKLALLTYVIVIRRTDNEVSADLLDETLDSAVISGSVDEIGPETRPDCRFGPDNEVYVIGLIITLLCQAYEGTKCLPFLLFPLRSRTAETLDHRQLHSGSIWNRCVEFYRSVYQA